MATSTQDWIDELKGISVLELSERIKAAKSSSFSSPCVMASAISKGIRTRTFSPASRRLSTLIRM